MITYFWILSCTELHCSRLAARISPGQYFNQSSSVNIPSQLGHRASHLQFCVWPYCTVPRAPGIPGIPTSIQATFGRDPFPCLLACSCLSALANPSISSPPGSHPSRTPPQLLPSLPSLFFPVIAGSRVSVSSRFESIDSTEWIESEKS